MSDEPVQSRYKVKFEGDKKSLKFLPADRSGKVTINYVNGDVYTGDAANQQKHGKGVYTWILKPAKADDDDDEDEQDDESAVKPVQQYTGAYVNNQRSGAGTMKYADGSVYTGEWLNNLRHGAGSYVYANGDKYIGLWQNDQKHGQGSYVYVSDGTVYSGVYSEGKCVDGEWCYYDEHQTCTALVKDNRIVQYVKA